MQGQNYKKSTHPAKDEWRKIRVSYILTFGTFWPFCAILSRYLLIHNRLPQNALVIVEGLGSPRKNVATSRPDVFFMSVRVLRGNEC